MLLWIVRLTSLRVRFSCKHVSASFDDSLRPITSNGDSKTPRNKQPNRIKERDTHRHIKNGNGEEERKRKKGNEKGRQYEEPALAIDLLVITENERKNEREKKQQQQQHKFVAQVRSFVCNLKHFVMGFLFCALQCLVFISIQRLLRVAWIVALSHVHFIRFFFRFSLRLFSSILSSSQFNFMCVTQVSLIMYVRHCFDTMCVVLLHYTILVYT